MENTNWRSALTPEEEKTLLFHEKHMHLGRLAVSAHAAFKRRIMNRAVHRMQRKKDAVS